MSLGFPGTGAPDGNGIVCGEIVGLNAAIDYAAGNDGGTIVSCPAANPHVIAVGATRFDARSRIIPTTAVNSMSSHPAATLMSTRTPMVSPTA